jgi:DNA-binding CsgD family transcriptional regulator
MAPYSATTRKTTTPGFIEPAWTRVRHPAAGRSRRDRPDPAEVERLEGLPDGTFMGRAERGGAPAAASPGAAFAYRFAMATMFSDLYEKVDFNLGATETDDLPTDADGIGADRCPERTYLLAAALLEARHIARAAQLLARLDSMTASRPDRRQWRSRIEFLWAIYAQQVGDPAGMLEHCVAAGSLGPGLRSGADGDQGRGAHSGLQRVDAVISHRLPLLATRAQIALGQVHQAEAIMLERYGGLEEAETNQPATLALLAYHQGRLGVATRLASAALEAAERQDTAAELVDLEARIVLAGVLFEHNQLDASWQQLQACLRLCWLTSAIRWMWAIEIELARVQVAQGAGTEAMHRLEDLRVKGAGLLSQPLLQRLNQVTIDCRLQLGDHDGALLLARSLLPSDIPCETLARVDLHSGRSDQALHRLDVNPSPNLAIHVRRLVLVARAEYQQGRTARAYDTARRAVEAARPERYIRPFLEDPLQTLPLLQGIGASDPYLAALVREAEQLAPPASLSDTVTLLEPLTEREGQILRRLPSHLTLRQIGLVMCLSTNTIKTHVKSIYRKIGAVSRDDAVTIARRHGLV